MTLRLLISLNLALLFYALKAGAQLAPAEDFFNGGAQLYISNNIPAALEKTETGLKIYPDDEKLKKLEQLLKQKQQQNQQQQNQQQQNQKQQKQQQQSQKNQQQNQQNNTQQQKSDEQKKADEQKQAEQKKNSEHQPPEQPVKPGELTPKEAKKLLDAQKGDEQLLQMKPDEKPRDTSRPFKDW